MPPPRLDRKCHPTLEKGCRRGEILSLERAAGRALELVGHLLVVSCGPRSVPGVAIGIQGGIGRLRRRRESPECPGEMPICRRPSAAPGDATAPMRRTQAGQHQPLAPQQRTQSRAARPRVLLWSRETHEAVQHRRHGLAALEGDQRERGVGRHAASGGLVDRCQLVGQQGDRRRSPASRCIPAGVLRPMESALSAPASRASWIRRAGSASQLAWSHNSPATVQATQSQRRPSSDESSSPENALTAGLKIGAAAPYPSVMRAANPSRRRSGARVG